MCMFSIYFCNDSILLMLPTPFREQTPPGLCETFKIRQAFVSITIVGIQFTQRNLKGQSTFSFLVLFFFSFHIATTLKEKTVRLFYVRFQAATWCWIWKTAEIGRDCKSAEATL